MTRRACAILLEDPSLGEQLSGRRLLSAIRVCTASTARLSRGVWSPRVKSARVRDGIGLLLLEGLLTRRVGVDGRFGAELLGSGDLLRPWQQDDAESTLPLTGEWMVLRPARVAVLDRDFLLRLTPYPEVTSALFGRAIKRARQLALSMAIVHQPRVDVRLHMFFWGLADRWGTVHPDGVRVGVQLTHAVLAEMVAAARPSVTKALGELGERGVVRWTGDSWLLGGPPPAELGEVVALTPPSSVTPIRS
jgi:CRP/FNR family transcriptional regulator, cyclic AMP receptor protein